MSIDDISLGLPDPIEANLGQIRSGADDLDDLHSDMLGRSGDTDTQMRSSADQFTDLIAWNIGSASADELMAWEETSKTLTYGAGVLRLWAEDIDTYLTERASIEYRWEEAKESARERPDMGPGPSNAEGLERYREVLHSEHAGIWGTLMGQAEQTKIDLRTGPSKDSLERMVEAGLLTAGQISTYGDHYPGMVPEEIDGSEPPHLVNAWWDSLSEDEREQAMADDPDLLRDLDGIPSTVRDQLNREHLDDEHEAVQTELEELRDELEEAEDGPAGSIERTSLNQDIRELEEQESTIRALRDELGENADESDQYLLALERGDNGRAIVAQGNPDTADNVATMVPGTNTTWESITNQTQHAVSVAAEGDRRDEDEEGSTAAITWIGYDAPSTSDAASSTKAENAVEELSSFHSGLRSTHQNPTPSNNTVIGHSYGSTVIGHTAKSDAGLDANELVLVGSPGTSVDDVRELMFSSEDVHSTTSENDHINDWWVFPHGQDPTSDNFGATSFESNPGPESGGIFFGDAHKQEEYFDNEVDDREKYDPLAYIGKIVSGNKPGQE